MVINFQLLNYNNAFMNIVYDRIVAMPEFIFQVKLIFAVCSVNLLK